MYASPNAWLNRKVRKRCAVCLPFSNSVCQISTPLRTLSSLHVAAHSCCLVSHSAVAFIMNLPMSVVLKLLVVALQVSSQPTTGLQPYCHPVSGVFKSNPDFWLHATPVLRAHWNFDYAPLVRRQNPDYWTNWKDISYLFALYVPSKEAQTIQPNVVTAVTLTPQPASTSQGSNLGLAIRWVILHILGIPPAMAPTTLTS